MRLVAEDSGLSEAERVERWRRRQLQRAGFPVHEARRIAASDCDLHLAIWMLERGCDPDLVEEILT